MVVSMFRLSFQSPIMNPFSSNTRLSGFTEPNEGMATDGDTYTDKSRLLFNGHIGAII